MKQISLHLRMIALVLLITVTAFIIATVTNYTDARKSILSSLQDNAATRVQNRADYMSTWIQSRLALVEVMSRTDKVRFGAEEERLAYLRAETQRSEGVFYSIGFADLNGRLPLSSGEILYIADEPTFKKALQGHYEISDPIIGKQMDSMHFTLEVPVYGVSKEIVGLVNATILLKTAAQIHTKYLAADADSIVLFNQSGQAIYPEQISPALQGISAELFKQDHGSIKINNKGSKEMIFYATVPTTSWLIGSSVPLRDFEAPLHALLSKTMLAITFAIVLMAGLLFVLFDREITRIRQLAAATETVDSGNFNEPLIQFKNREEEENPAKEEFIARISHELRTPLSGVIGLAQLMQKTTMNEIQKDYLDKILSSSYAMLAIINEILDFSKVEAGKLELESISFSPERLLSKVADMIGVFLIEKDQFDFIVDVENSVPDALIGDPTRMEQILLNLCFNAIKFTEHGYVILKAEGLKSSGKMVEVRFSVEDTGIGMSEMQIKRLFTPYTQGDHSTNRKYGGTGLGLFISKNLIEMMGGTLEVESEPDKGSRFYFILKLQAGMISEKENMRLDGEFGCHPVWLVEDGSRMRKYLSRTITGFALQAVEFTTWKEALGSLLEGNAPEGTVMLLDMEAADMFGHETFYELRQAAAERGVYTLAMTSAYGREEINRMPPSLKPDGILVKPINRSDLHRALVSIFEGKQSKHALLENKSADPTKLVRGKILLADDYEINRQVAITLLESHGFEVKVATNGYEVLTMLEEPGWDLVLMDIQMPKMDGKETTRRIRQDPRFEKLPIIAMTAHATPKELASFPEFGMNETLIKPIEEGTLLASIDQLLEKSRNRKLDATGYQNARQEEIPVFLENLAGIQAKDALMRINGKVPIFMHMLQTFKRDFSDHEMKIRQAYEQGEHQEMMHLLHSLRGAAGTISARDLYMAAGRLEDFFEADLVDEAEWSRLLNEVSSALLEIISSLEQLD